jgi:hypothetical protein
MKNVIPQTPTAGRIVKKIVDLNPILGVQDIIYIVKKATMKRNGVEVIDEVAAMELARTTLISSVK